MEELKNIENNEIKKIKATSVDIVVNGNVDKPYYEIKYYNIDDRNWHIGFGSYNLSFVYEWYKEYFEVEKNYNCILVHGDECVNNNDCANCDYSELAK